MPSVTLQNAIGVGDILETSNYRFTIGAIPGYTADANLEIQCTQAVYPGSQNEVFPVSFPGGHELNYRGRRIMPKTLSLTYAETVVMNVTTAFGRWLEYVCGVNTGNSSGYKYSGNSGGGYSVDGAQLVIFDTIGAIASIVTFFGLQPNDRPDLNFDSGGSAAAVVSVTLTYDYYYSDLFGPAAPSSSGNNSNMSTLSSVGSG
jgi:hypothetical protein